MPKLPGGERAVIDPRKLRDYILAPRHPLGRFKAAFFNTLGYNADNWELLAAELRKAALEHEAEPDDRTPYGQKYRVRSILNRSKWPGSAGGRGMDSPERRGHREVYHHHPAGTKMRFKLLDTVVLTRDFPAHSLKAGDLGTVVELYQPEGLEVEFVTASGQTGALVTVTVRDVRQVADTDLVTVRSLVRSA